MLVYSVDSLIETVREEWSTFTKQALVYVQILYGEVGMVDLKKTIIKSRNTNCLLPKPLKTYITTVVGETRFISLG